MPDSYTLDEIIAIADEIYPDGLILKAYKAKGKPIGDTLAQFIANELSENYDAEATRWEQLKRAHHVLCTAQGELGSVVRAFDEKVEEQTLEEAEQKEPDGHVEIFQGMEIVLVETIGPVKIYQRPEYKQLGMNKYVVFLKDTFLRDFPNKREAHAWVAKNKQISWKSILCINGHRYEYSWWGEGFASDEFLVALEDAARDRISEMTKEGFTSGELNYQTDNDQLRGWWEEKP